MTWWLSHKYNLVGHTFGRLTVTHAINEVGRRRWVCRCKCGGRTEVTSNNLKGGKVISCGCALQGCNRKEPFLWLYNKLRADPRHIAFDLTFEQFCSFTTTSNCHYCGAPVVWAPHSRNKHNGAATNLDRKDNSEGYVFENLVVCCTRCNLTKGNRFTYEEFVRIGKVIEDLDREEAEHEGIPTRRLAL